MAQTGTVEVKNDLPAVINREKQVAARMNRFIKAYEAEFGNISAACVRSGASRRTVYRWLYGTAPVHRRFQAKLAKIRPSEALVDAAEGVLLRSLAGEDAQARLTAAIFTLKSRGKRRGWSERSDVVVEDEVLPASRSRRMLHNGQTVEQVKAAIMTRAAECGRGYGEELERFLERYEDRLPDGMAEALRAM